MRKRILKPLLALGLMMILFSFAPSSIGSDVFHFPDVQYGGILIMNTGDVYVRANAITESTFSLYLFDNESGARVFREYSMENVTPLFSIENVSQYDGIIDLPGDEVYYLIVTQSNISPSDSATNIAVYRATPHPRVFGTGLVLMFTGSLLAYPEVYSILKHITEWITNRPKATKEGHEAS